MPKQLLVVTPKPGVKLADVCVCECVCECEGGWVYACKYRCLTERQGLTIF